jgi:hypothetical protein
MSFSAAAAAAEAIAGALSWDSAMFLAAPARPVQTGPTALGTSLPV